MSEAVFDVLIAGGGVIGLTTGLQMAESGFSVAIFDQGNFGEESSWAGAGIVAPPQCSQDAGPLDRLRSLSIRGLATFSVELQELTGIDNGYQVCGGLEIPFKRESTSVWCETWAHQGIRFEPWCRSDCITRFPGLDCSFTPDGDCFWLPEKAQIRNPWHIRALLERLKALPVALHPNEPIEEWCTTSGQSGSLSAKSGLGTYHFRNAVLCTGAWTQTISQKFGIQLPIAPVKGQIILYQGRPGLIPGILEQGKLYLVPRKDGLILCGSTEEYSGFNKNCNPDSVHHLNDWATRLVPALKDCPIVKTWCGLRPGSPDGAPFLGPLPHFPQLMVAAGHFRSGLQLSWGTAHVITGMLKETISPLDWDAFLPSRPRGLLTSIFQN
ncbi:MAG: NAD(P)/FAD-dependent oxidoreductase [Gemmataceae bacterium]